MSTSRPGGKRGRLSSGPSTSYRGGAPKKFNGFEDEKEKPERRSTLDVDPRFFPNGIQPGTILEIKGPEKSGKTFMLTYIIARVLSVYQEKRVVLLDTRHKFSVRNLVSILWHFDKDLKSLISKDELLAPNFQSLLGKSQKISSYLNRIMVFSCYSPEDLMFTLGPAGESQLSKMLLRDKTIGLVAVDCIDDYSFSEILANCQWADTWPNIMDLLRDSVRDTRCPVVATTLMMAFQRDYRKMPKKFNSNQGSSMAGSSTEAADDDNDGEEKLLHNFTIDHSVFTEILDIKPEPKAALEKMAQTLRGVGKINHCATAYLRSKHSANTAGSGENHRVRFSIFSDMLWVEDKKTNS